MWFYLTPRYLQKQINTNWVVQGSSDLEVTDFAISVDPATMLYSAPVPLFMKVNAEIYNKGEEMLELIEVHSSVTDCTGKVKAIRVDGPDRIELVDSTYYDMLPSKIGILIPPGQKRPVEIWSGGLLSDDPSLFKKTLGEGGKESVSLTPQYFWQAFGLPVLSWCKVNVAFMARPVKQNVSEWYQYWDRISVVKVEETPVFLRGWYYSLWADFDPKPIFDNLVVKYGNKGVPDPRDPTSGRIITLPDGQQVVAGIFHPKLRLIITYYDKNGKFIGFDQSLPFDKADYEIFLSNGGGHFQMNTSSSDFPKGAKIDKYKVYLELVPQ